MPVDLVKNPVQYKFVALDGVERPPVTSFKNAYIQMYKWTKKALEKGLSFQVLETGIWIETPLGTPIFFYDARDLAYEQGLMKDGKLVV